MDGQGCGDFLWSSRDLSAFEMEIRMAKSKVEVMKIIGERSLHEEDFIDEFPHLAKMFQDLPDEDSPAA
jgi:hypothetical protein